jgi:hypothetical protein
MRFLSRTAGLHTPPFLLRKNCCVQAYCCFATIFACLKLDGLQHLCIAGEGQCYGSPKNGLSEANHLATRSGCAWRRSSPLAAVVIYSQAFVLAQHLK